MKAFATLCTTSLIALSLAACNPAPTPAPDTHDADVKAITDTEVQANQAWAAKDADKVMTFYADDALLMTPGAEAVHGKDAIRDELKQMLADPALSLTFQSSKVDVAKSGDLGYTAGTYKLTVTDPATHKPVTDHGNYVTSFRKQADGSWKAVADIASSAVPPMPPPKKK
ncbi:MAG TPA: SgcJ/EcaC family oxidoreductase [Terracidiphilus sp.]|nr:SgcJ/EcaC family oxidoreductase [Terracidiphilus sp.]